MSSFQSENVAMYTAAELITNRVLLGQIAGDLTREGWITPGQPLGGALTHVAALMRWLYDRATGASVQSATAAASNRPASPDEVSDQIDWLQTIVRVEPVRDTRLVDIKVDHINPRAARTIAERLSARFVDYQNGRTAGADTTGLASLRQQAEQVRDRIRGSEGRLYGGGGAGMGAVESRVQGLPSSAPAPLSPWTRGSADPKSTRPHS